MGYVNDMQRGNVVHLEGDSWFAGHGFFLIGDDYTFPGNPNGGIFDTANGRVGLWFKNDNYGTPLTLSFMIEDANSDPALLHFVTDDGTDTTVGINYYFYLETGMNNGQWHFAEFDLPARLAEASAPEPFARLHAFMVFGEDLDVRFDDIICGQGLLEKSYQLIADAQIGAYLGAQSGSLGGIDQDPWSKWYYQYNDLGTVVATTDSAGEKIGVYAPDFYGNYREIDGARPDTMGLTSKFFDADMGLYYFNARWYDPERGRWMSPDPLSYAGGINLYVFVEDMPDTYVDPSGFCPEDGINCLSKCLELWLLCRTAVLITYYAIVRVFCPFICAGSSPILVLPCRWACIRAAGIARRLAWKYCDVALAACIANCIVESNEDGPIPDFPPPRRPIPMVP